MSVGRYNAEPSTHLAILHQVGQYLHADMVRRGWRPHWAKDRAAPISARVEKVPLVHFFRAIWPHCAIIAIDNLFECVDEGRPKKQSYLVRHRDRTPILCAAIGQYPTAEHEADENDGLVIVTDDSAGRMVDIHDRRPVTLIKNWSKNGWIRRHPKSTRNRGADTGRITGSI